MKNKKSRKKKKEKNQETIKKNISVISYKNL